MQNQNFALDTRQMLDKYQGLVYHNIQVNIQKVVNIHYYHRNSAKQPQDRYRSLPEGIQESSLVVGKTVADLPFDTYKIS